MREEAWPWLCYAVNRMHLVRRVVILAVVALCSSCSNTIAVGRLEWLAPDQAAERAKSITAEFGGKPASITVEVPDEPDGAAYTSFGNLSLLDERTFLLRVPGQEDVRIPFDHTQ